MPVRIIGDGGHGGHDSGAVGNGLYEKDITLKLSNYFVDILNNDYKGVVAKATRTNDKFISLSGRADMANDFGADLFVSFHTNSFDGSADGFESFIYNGGVGQDTKEAQDIIHEEVMKVNDLDDRGQKQANFAVLRETVMPALLTENGFIDNAQDAEKLKDDDYLYKVAKAHAKGVAKLFNLKRDNDRTDDTHSTKDLYEVIAGTFANYNNAKIQEKRIEDKGIDAYVKKSGKYYEVIAGTFSNYGNAKKQSNHVEGKGFDTYIK